MRTLRANPPASEHVAMRPTKLPNGLDESKKDDGISTLGAAFRCSAPIIVIAICLGVMLTPEENYAEMGGVFIPIAVYGFTGFWAAAVSFLAAVLLFFPE